MPHPIPILMYHSIDTECATAYRRWTVTPGQFARHMDVLRDRGCRPVSIAALAETLRSGTAVAKGTVVITFDDGLADFGRNAVPILERYGFASTLFVTTGYVGQTARWLADLGEGGRPMMSWNDIAALASSDVEVGAHTHSHPQLDLLGHDEARIEIETSRSLIEAHAGQPVRSFAYPHGYSTRAVRDLVAQAGFSAACRVAHALSAPHEPALGLSRIIMTDEVSPARLGRFLDGQELPVAPALDRPSVLAWRLYRKARARLADPPRSSLVPARRT